MVRLKEEELRGMTYQTHNTQEIARIYCLEWKINRQFCFLKRSLTNYKRHDKTNDRKEESYQKTYHNNFPQSIRMGECQAYNVEKPQIVKDTIIHDILKIRKEIKEREILIR